MRYYGDCLEIKKNVHNFTGGHLGLQPVAVVKKQKLAIL